MGIGQLLCELIHPCWWGDWFECRVPLACTACMIGGRGINVLSVYIYDKATIWGAAGHATAGSCMSIVTTPVRAGFVANN